MRNLIVLFLLATSFYTQAQSIEFFKGTWEEALAEAKAQDKLIFVDAMAEWCGPCKRMASLVFTHAAVGTFFNENFVNVKMDMEKGEGPTFGKKYPVAAFPTLFFIDFNGNVVQKIRGAQTADALLGLGKAALNKVDKSALYAEDYEKGKREPELIYNYVKALNKANKPSLKVANDYLKEQKDLTSDINLRIILEAATEADSRIFDLLIEHRAKIAALTSEEAVNKQIEKACQMTVNKAIEFQTEMLLTEAQQKMKKHYPAKANSFLWTSEMDYAKATNNADRYLAACKAYAQVVEDNPVELVKMARDIQATFADNDKAMKMADKLTKMAAKG